MIMRKLFQWVMTATLICGLGIFTSCSSDNDDNQSSNKDAIAMIVKNGEIDYWHQIEKSFRDACKERGLEACYYATSAENAYEEQIDAVEKLRKLSDKTLKGIIFTPSYGLDGKSAEAEVAAFARERGIPVIILDSHVSADGPLAGYPYIGTDNTAAGKVMAEKVPADKVAVFAMTNSPGIERAKAFKAQKPNAVIYTVGDKANDEVKAVLDEYNDFVFFNGNGLVDAIGILGAAHKRVYTFDAYGEFLDELIAGSAFFKGIMAQNTFGMAKKAVEAVLANAKKGEMVPTYYITEDNLNDTDVLPFLQFYNKKATPVIDNLAEKILGRWIESEWNGKPSLTNSKSVTTFVSSTKAISSSSKPDFTDRQVKWSAHRECEVKITGNKVALTAHPEGMPSVTLLDEYIITSVTATTIDCKFKHTTFHDGLVEGLATEKNIRLVKVDTDYSKDVIGTWEGMISDGEYGRWTLKADGTHEYAHRAADGSWKKMNDVIAEYFVDGNLFCARWKNVGEGTEELREWWEIESIQDGVMKWTALRQNVDGTTYTETTELKKVEK